LRNAKASSGNIKEGDKINGVIKRIEDYGLFIDIEGTKLHGLCHKSQLTDNAEADVSEALRGFRVGDRVKAMVISTEKGRIGLSLKPSHFHEEDFEEGEDSEGELSGDGDEFGVVDGEDDSGDEGVEERDADVAMSSDVERDDVPEDSEEEEEQDDEDEDETMEVDAQETVPTFQQAASSSKASSSKTIPSLTLSEGFQWFGESRESGDEIESSSDESDQEGESSKKKNKKKKRKEIEKDLTADMHTKAPESNSDFERLLLGSPNSSYLWIQYMSFQLQIAEIDKAREIGRRAVKTISFREEGERLNVWIALLNLENVYGTEESMEAVFRDAARANDSKTVHLRMAAIFDQSGKLDVSTFCS